MDQVNVSAILKELLNGTITRQTTVGIDHMSYLQFSENVESIILTMSKKIVAEKYSFTRYKEHLIVKNRFSRPRLISIPTLRDRLCLKFIDTELKKITAKIDSKLKPSLPEKMVSEVYNKIISDNNKFNSFIKIDITDFFGSISHFRLLTLLKDFKVPEYLIKLINTAIENPTYPSSKDELNSRGLPQGISISSILSQIYMFDFVRRIEESCGSVYVVRYVDDMIVLCDSNEREGIHQQIINILEKFYMLHVNKGKDKIGNLGVDEFNFLGYKFMPKETSNGLPAKTILSVKNESVDKLRRRLIATMIKFKRKSEHSYKGLNIKALTFNLNLIISGLIEEKSDLNGEYKKRYGWLFFFSQINDWSLLYSLDAFVKNKIIHIFKDDNGKIYEGVNSFVSTMREIRYGHKKEKMHSNVFYPNSYGKEDKIYFLKEVVGLKQIDSRDEVVISRKFNDYIYSAAKKNEKEILSGFS